MSGRAICRAYGLRADLAVEVDLEDRRGRPLDARLASVRGGTVGTVSDEIVKLIAAEPLS